MREWKDTLQSQTVQFASFERARGARRGRGGGPGPSHAGSARGQRSAAHRNTALLSEDIGVHYDDVDIPEYLGTAAHTHAQGTLDPGGLSSDSSDSSDDEGQEAQDPLQYDSSAVVDAFFRSIPGVADVSSQLRAAAQEVLQRSIDRTAQCTVCPTCGTQGDPVGLTPFSVTVVTWDQPVRVDVPRLSCRKCCRSYTLHPTVLGCLPDTSVSWDLLRWKDGITILWWHCSLLQLFTSLQYYNGHLGMDRFCAALKANWSDNGCAGHGLTVTQLRQRLSPATQRYRFLRGLVEDLPEQLPGWPAGALNACACCGDATDEHCQLSAGGTAAAAPAADPARRAVVAAAAAAAVAAAAGAHMTAAKQGSSLGRGGGSGGAADGGLAAAAPAVYPAHMGGGQDGVAAAAPAAGIAAAAAAVAAAAGAHMTAAEQGSSQGRGGGSGGAVDGGLAAAAPAAYPAHMGGGQDELAAAASAAEIAAAAAAVAAAAGAHMTAAEQGSSLGRGGGSGSAADGGLAAAAPAVYPAHMGGGQDGVAAAAPAAGIAAAAAAGVGEGSSLGRGGSISTGPDIWRPMLAATDPAGPGPSSLHTAAFDCNFKLNLFKKKGRSHKYDRDYRQLSRRRYTLGNAYVQSFEPPEAALDVGRNTDCSSFTADKVLAKEEAGKLVTAAGVVLCRHGMLFRLVNLFHGERHMYATAAAASILAAGTAVQFWWYDIACRWSRSWQKWHQALDQPAALLGLAAAAMVSLVPPFHSYAHSYACQKKFGHHGHVGAGRGTGEIVEIFNAQVGKQGEVLRYTAPVHRESVLEDVGRRYCRQVELGLPARIYRMQLRARAARDAAKSRIATLEATLTKQQVEMARGNRGATAQPSQQRHDQPKRHVDTDEVVGEPGWRAAYARCRLSLMKLLRVDTVDNPADPVPLSVLVAGGDSLTLRQRPALIKQLEEEKKKLEHEHSAAAPPPRDWGTDSPEFKGAVGELAESEIKKIAGEIEALVMDYNSLKLVAEKLAGRKKEQGYALKEKQRVKGQLREQWGRLAAWCRVDAAGQQGPEEKARNRRVLTEGLNAVLGGVFPWDVAGSSGGRVVASLVRCDNQQARAVEELTLIEAEIGRGCTYYKRRVTVLQAVLATSGRAVQLLLKQHLSRCEFMLQAFEGLKRGDVPDDTSLSVDCE